MAAGGAVRAVLSSVRRAAAAIGAALDDRVPSINECLVLPILGSILPVLLMSANPVDAAARGRVRVADGTVVTDNGALLRGAHGNANNMVYQNLSWWTNLRDNYHLNVVRLDTRITKPGNSTNVSDMVDLDALFAKVDKAVDMAEQAGMYLIIDNHTSCCVQSNPELMRRFWRYAAPRYKDRTHVIYEIQNEPGPSQPTKDSKTMIDSEAEIYNLIRSVAPATHIVVWSFAKTDYDRLTIVSQNPSIDYANASVGIHPYTRLSSLNFSQIERLKRAGYPLFVTEFAKCCGLSSTAKTKQVWQYLETNKISWVYLDLRFTPTGYGNYGDGIASPGDWPMTWRKGD